MCVCVCMCAGVKSNLVLTCVLVTISLESHAIEANRSSFHNIYPFVCQSNVIITNKAFPNNPSVNNPNLWEIHALMSNKNDDLLYGLSLPYFIFLTQICQSSCLDMYYVCIIIQYLCMHNSTHVELFF